MPTALALSLAQRPQLPSNGETHTGHIAVVDDGTLTWLACISAHRVSTWQIDAGTLPTPLPLNTRLSLPSAGDAETLASLGKPGRQVRLLRTRARLWNSMFPEVRPHQLYAESWVMMEAETLRRAGQMGPPNISSARGSG